MMSSTSCNEFSLIEKYFAPLAASFPGSLGLKDDAAILTPKPGYDLVITKDALVENVHFFEKDPAYNIAKKLLGVNLSDLAAMGAKPVAYLLAIALPRTSTDEWLHGFSQGFAASITEFGGALIGGDTVSHDGGLMLSLTAIGEVKQGSALKRSCAKIGDFIYVSGTIGDSYLGLQILKNSNNTQHTQAEKYLTERYYFPIPRLALGAKLIGIARACVDVSDGLIADLGHICECSHVGAEIKMDDIPVSLAARQLQPDIKNLIAGGDDYELLFTAPAEMEKSITDLSKELHIPIAKIGQITAGDKVKLLDASGTEVVLEKTGYQHF
jgi:thiamine-monophosphate kinase